MTTPQQLADCILAVGHQTIEERPLADTEAGEAPHVWQKKTDFSWWNVKKFEYRIKPSPRKCWVKWQANVHATAVECTIHEPTEPGWQIVLEKLD